MIRRIFVSKEHYFALRNAMINELNSRGIFTDDRLSTMIEKLKILDYLKPERPTILEQKYNGESKKSPMHLIDFDSNFLAREIKKREPNFDTRGMDKEKLLEKLDKTLKGTPTFLGLLSKYKYFEVIPVHDLIKLLKRYTEPFNVEQDDLFYLINIKKYVQRIVILVFKDIKKLSFKDMSIFLKAMDSFFNVFEKHYSDKSQSFPNQILQYVLEHALDHTTTCNFQDLLRLIDSAFKLQPNFISETLNSLQIEMINHPLIPGYLTNEELLLVVSNFPVEAVRLNEEIVEKYIKMYEERLEDFWIGDKINAFIGIQRSGSRISQKIIKSLDELDLDYLSYQKQPKIINLFKSLSESQTLTKDQADMLIDWFQFRMEINTKSFQVIADMVHAVYSNGYGFFLMKEPNYILRLLNPNAKMNLESILKFSITFGRFLNYPDFFSLVVRTFKRIKKLDETLPNFIPLVIDMQNALIESCEEVPVFNYQLDSFKPLYCNKKTKLIRFVHQLLKKHQPDSPVIMKFHSDFPFAFKPGHDVFENLTKDNIFYACKAIWRFQIFGETANNVISSASHLINFDDKINTRELFYMAACIPDPSLYKFKWVETTSVYYLPLCYDFHLVPIITQELLTKISQSPEVFGEVLFKTLLIALKNEVDKKIIKKLTQNLAYEPKNYHQVGWDFKLKLVKELMKNKDSVDFYVLSVFINQNFENFSREELVDIFNFFQDQIDEVFFGLRENFRAVGIIHEKNESFHYFPERNYRILDEITDDTQENSRILIEMIKKNIFNVSFVDSFMKDLQNVKKNDESIQEGVLKVLDYISHFGNFNDHLETIFNFLSDNLLLSSLPKKDLVNLIFSKQFSSNALPDLPNISNYLEKLKENDTFPLKTHANGLLYYPPFTYNTQFEPRYALSCDSRLNQYPRAHSEYFPVTQEEFYSALKLFLVLEHFGMEQNEEITQKINSYLVKISKSKLFYFSSAEIQTEQYNSFSLMYKEFDEDFSESPLTGSSQILVTFHDTKKAFLLLDKGFFVDQGDQVGNEEGFITKVFRKYIEKVTGLHITSFNTLKLKDKINDPDHPFVYMTSKEYLEDFNSYSRYPK